MASSVIFLNEPFRTATPAFPLLESGWQRAALAPAGRELVGVAPPTDLSSGLAPYYWAAAL
jgi:hypothetical protein